VALNHSLGGFLTPAIDDLGDTIHGTMSNAKWRNVNALNFSFARIPKKKFSAL
jgi:hypothetical protein